MRKPIPKLPQTAEGQDCNRGSFFKSFLLESGQSLSVEHVRVFWRHLIRGLKYLHVTGSEAPARPDGRNEGGAQNAVDGADEFPAR